MKYQYRHESNFAWFLRKHEVNEIIGGIVSGVILALVLFYCI